MILKALDLPEITLQNNDFRGTACYGMVWYAKAWFSYIADGRRLIVSDDSKRKFTKDFTHE